MSEKKEKKTVKARVHHGSDSLDLTLPTDFKREYSVNAGDIFEITALEDKEGNIEFRYKRVYSSE